MAILNKKVLACYIKDKYQKEYHREISPIKLQKAMYFLYAMWGGKIADAQLSGDKDTDDDARYKEYDINLFDASFEAWKYGPVDYQIYCWYKNNALVCDEVEIENLFNNSQIYYISEVKEYVDELLGKIFRTSDFGLVDLTHKDKCWKDAILREDKTMSNESIIRDYQSA